eukprot:scaffold50584_cov63-Phaeocystis_antarctica.AAC.2
MPPANQNFDAPARNELYRGGHSRAASQQLCRGRGSELGRRRGPDAHSRLQSVGLPLCDRGPTEAARQHREPGEDPVPRAVHGAAQVQPGRVRHGARGGSGGGALLRSAAEPRPGGGDQGWESARA